MGVSASSILNIAAAAGRTALALPGQVAREGLHTASLNARGQTHEANGAAVPSLARPLEAARYLGGLALDHFMYGLLAGSAPVPPPSDYPRIQQEAAQARAVFVQKGWDKNPASFHRAPQAPVITGTDTRKVDSKREKLTLHWKSAYAPRPELPGTQRYNSYAALKDVEAHVLRYTDTKRPWVIYLHGFAMGRDQDLSMTGLSKLHQTLGVNVATVPFPFHGRRSVEGKSIYGVDTMDTLNGLSQGVSDVRQLIAWIRKTQPGQPIALVGMSMGGYSAGLLASLEKDLGAVIAEVPAPEITGQVIASAKPMLGDAYAKDAAVAIGPISQAPLKPVVSSSKVTVFGAEGDRIAEPTGALQLGRKFGVTPEWLPDGHVTSMFSVQPELEAELRRRGFVHA